MILEAAGQSDRDFFAGRRVNRIARGDHPRVVDAGTVSGQG